MAKEKLLSKSYSNIHDRNKAHSMRAKSANTVQQKVKKIASLTNDKGGRKFSNEQLNVLELLLNHERELKKKRSKEIIEVLKSNESEDHASID